MSVNSWCGLWNPTPSIIHQPVLGQVRCGQRAPRAPFFDYSTKNRTLAGPFIYWKPYPTTRRDGAADRGKSQDNNRSSELLKFKAKYFNIVQLPCCYNPITIYCTHDRAKRWQKKRSLVYMWVWSLTILIDLNEILPECKISVEIINEPNRFDRLKMAAILNTRPIRLERVITFEKQSHLLNLGKKLQNFVSTFTVIFKHFW